MSDEPVSGENESVDVPADDPQPTGPADPGEITEVEPTRAMVQEGVEEDVPEGTIAEVQEWVGNDPARAQRALDVERTGQARTTLMSDLEAKAGG